MKKLIVLDGRVICIIDFAGNCIENKYAGIKKSLKGTNPSERVEGVIRAEREDVSDTISMGDDIGSWGTLNPLNDLNDIGFTELRMRFVEQIEVSHLALDLLDTLEMEAGEDVAHKFMADKLAKEFKEIEIARFLYDIK